MKKLLLSLSACAFASLSFASVNLNLDQEYWDGVPGGSVTVFGTIDLTPGWDVSLVFLENPNNASGPLTIQGFAPTLVAYLGLNTSSSYSGALFTIDIPAGATPGLYDFNNLLATSSDRSEFGVHATRASDQATAADYENYGINVQAVPEPASMAALGLGALALLRRKK